MIDISDCHRLQTFGCLFPDLMWSNIERIDTNGNDTVRFEVQFKNF